jgi:hypothetical protein
MKAASPRPTTADQRPKLQVVAPEVGASVNMLVSPLGARDGPSLCALTGAAVGSSTGDLVGEAVGRSASVHPAT